MFPGVHPPRSHLRRRTALRGALAAAALAIGAPLAARAQQRAEPRAPAPPPPAPPVQPRSVARSGHFVTSDKVRLHYLEAGQGRTILFVPGWSMPAFIWEPQLAGLSPRWRTVAMDPRSQGRSQVARSGHEPSRRGRDIGEAIERLAADRVVLVGWSLGVLDSLAFVQEHGDARIAGLVLVDNSVGEGTPPAPSRPSTFLPSLRAEREKTMASFVKAMYATPQDPAYLEAVTRAALATPYDAQAKLLSYQRPREYWRDALYATRRPVLYAIRPRFAAQGDAVKARHADAGVEVFADAGHALFVDRAERFNALLEAFCSGRAQW
ncbi:MAG: alpha/beta hydrolase [Alphaproteobacteria bacterium]|nr:alpha/beta hydrolase [Alphaproteobacteria bacterium]